MPTLSLYSNMTNSLDGSQKYARRPKHLKGWSTVERNIFNPRCSFHSGLQKNYIEKRKEHIEPPKNDDSLSLDSLLDEKIRNSFNKYETIQYLEDFSYDQRLLNERSSSYNIKNRAFPSIFPANVSTLFGFNSELMREELLRKKSIKSSGSSPHLTLGLKGEGNQVIKTIESEDNHERKMPSSKRHTIFSNRQPTEEDLKNKKEEEADLVFENIDYSLFLEKMAFPENFKLKKMHRCISAHAFLFGKNGPKSTRISWLSLIYFKEERIFGKEKKANKFQNSLKRVNEEKKTETSQSNKKTYAFLQKTKKSFASVMRTSKNLAENPSTKPKENILLVHEGTSLENLDVISMDRASVKNESDNKIRSRQMPLSRALLIAVSENDKYLNSMAHGTQKRRSVNPSTFVMLDNSSIDLAQKTLNDSQGKSEVGSLKKEKETKRCETEWTCDDKINLMYLKKRPRKKNLVEGICHLGSAIKGKQRDNQNRVKTRPEINSNNFLKGSFLENLTKTNATFDSQGWRARDRQLVEKLRASVVKNSSLNTTTQGLTKTFAGTIYQEKKDDSTLLISKTQSRPVSIKKNLLFRSRTPERPRDASPYLIMNFPSRMSRLSSKASSPSQGPQKRMSPSVNIKTVSSKKRSFYE